MEEEDKRGCIAYGRNTAEGNYVPDESGLAGFPVEDRLPRSLGMPLSSLHGPGVERELQLGEPEREQQGERQQRGSVGQELHRNMDTVSFEELAEAYLDCRRRKSTTLGAELFEMDLAMNIARLCDEINSRSYKTSPSTCFLVYEPKLREVFASPFRDRVVHHFIRRELEPCLEKELIYDTASCRLGKGTLFAVKRAQRFMRQAQENENKKAYYLRLDISGYFMSIDRDMLWYKIDRLISKRYKGTHEELLRYLLRIVVYDDPTKDCIFNTPFGEWASLPKRKSLFYSDGKGLPIGNLTSQMFGNLYLSEIDHAIKARERFYSRYVDDMAVINIDKSHLLETRDIVEEKLSGIGLKLNKRKTHIGLCDYGMDYVGKLIKPYSITIPCDSAKRMAQKMSTARSLASVNSILGCAKGFMSQRRASKLIEAMPDAYTLDGNRMVAKETITWN